LASTWSTWPRLTSPVKRACLVWVTQNNQLAREIDALRRAKDDRERELEADNATMRREAEGLRSELESILRELQMIMDNKMGLELEIAAYRKLLEGEETRSASWSSTSLLSTKYIAILLVACSSGRASVCGRCAFAVLRSTCS